jgi:hypothetical protein
MARLSRSCAAALQTRCYRARDTASGAFASGQDAPITSFVSTAYEAETGARDGGRGNRPGARLVESGRSFPMTTK